MALPHDDGRNQHDEVVRLLVDAPDGLSDGELTRALAPSFSGIRPQTVNQLCRRMVAAGTLERVGSRPIRNRLVAVPSTVDADPEPAATPPGAVETPPHIRGTNSTVGPEPSPEPSPAPEPVPEAAPADGVEILPHRGGENSTSGGEPEPPRFDALRAVADGRERPARARRPIADDGLDDGLPADDDADDDADHPDLPRRRSSSPGCRAERASDGARVSLPVWDALQGWSRTANVAAALADWLRRQGATIRAASANPASPAHDLVVRLGGDDLHVEVTGWPPDGARTHPTTLAADWFTAATRAAEMRRRAHPRARVVIALPDTRRYRALTEDRADALAGVGTEVWFVAPGGAVHPR